MKLYKVAFVEKLNSIKYKIRQKLCCQLVLNAWIIEFFNNSKLLLHKENSNCIRKIKDWFLNWKIGIQNNSNISKMYRHLKTWCSFKFGIHVLQTAYSKHFIYSYIVFCKSKNGSNIKGIFFKYQYIYIYCWWVV